MLRSDFAYELPEELIARHPAARRSDSRLLYLDGATGAVADHRFTDLPSLLRHGDLLVFNDTRVIPARLHGRKQTGGHVEILLERVVDAERALVQLRASKPPAAGSRIELPGELQATVLGREGDFWLLDFGSSPTAVFERYGEMPLPPARSSPYG
jgi:S-adenosylmethionine:tRNA ribosyltransferase-isomerase